ncbi:MAG: glycosyltransferase family 1 protein, partial [Sediminibacterium sp.]|nr:glycosyltransferase family 1 protein [Sediminibacterium sp.]
PYVYSGYETFAKELSERLVAKGVRVKIYCHKNLFTTHPPQVNGIDLIYVPTIQHKILSQFIHSFLSMMHACCSKTDVILAVNAANGPWGLIAKIFRKPACINVDGVEWERPKWKGLGAKYFYYSAWLATKLYPIIITDADEMRKVYLNTFGKDSTVIAYGANIRYPQHPEKLQELQLTPDSYYLIVGRLIPDNNAELLIDGFAAAGSSKKLVIVGDVPYRDSYANKMKEKASNNIIFLGYIKDADLLAELYHHCFAYLHGHAFGGTNPSLLKALAYGCAVMAINTRFSAEMLSNGQYGLFFEPNPQSIAQLMRESEQEPEKLAHFRAIAREGLGIKYNWDAVTNAYLAVINKLHQRS